jgi:hypothetical protein
MTARLPLRKRQIRPVYERAIPIAQELNRRASTFRRTAR